MSVRDRLGEAWQRLNPAEPGTGYLVKLMAFMIGAFIVGLILGNIG